MSTFAQKRFWSSAQMVKLEDGYGVELDGRSVRTPAKAMLCVPVAAWATGIAQEWEAQVDTIDPTSMPLTQMANVAIDRVTDQRSEVAAMLCAYGGSDLLCYRADAPQGLIDRQSQLWDPWLDWAASRFTARLVVTQGIVPVDQPGESLAKLEAAVNTLDPFALTAFHDLVTLSGSLVLALAVREEELAPAQAWDLSRLDELWQIEQWGEDAEAEQMAALKRQAFLRSAQVTHWLKG
ncbi:MAG: ATP12 family protein [Pseudomonadota bacterium]